MNEPGSTEEITESLKTYINNYYELIKLQATERASVIGSALISGFLIVMTVFLIILFCSLGAGFYLSQCFNNNYIGFVIVAGFYLILSLIIILNKKKMIDTPMRDRIIRKMLQED
ncbi:MAG: phage holin family protein [Bacteroidota bacterium]